MSVRGQRDLEQVSVASPRLAPRKEDSRVERVAALLPLGAPTKAKPVLVNPQDFKLVREEKPGRLEGRVCASATIVEHQRQGQRIGPVFFVYISNDNHLLLGLSLSEV